ncbi:sigma-70 family RNA polymerase sigma factor [Neiella holothuriorum]|uniref:sigma-70 family RNA polymerase sigma factor n=1 Tax=Neiella holothuriorum TaxID=2870530 RepID=UPI00298F7035|nr:sigma-70 family RNA polymerase sigma factor [Neiella holothuriorum]
MTEQIRASVKGAFPCALQAWHQHEQSLLQWLLRKTQRPALSQDVLQDVFIKLMQQREAFCSVTNGKAWLFRVAKNLLIDHVRKERFVDLLDDELLAEADEEENAHAAVDLLALSCLPRVLSELENQYQHIITACDLQGMTQQQFADSHELSLPAVKSRLRRARQKLKRQIESSCQVRLDEQLRVCCFTARGTKKESD